MVYHDPAVARAKASRMVPPPGKPHGVPLPGTERPGRTPIYRNWLAKDEMLTTIDPKVSCGELILCQIGVLGTSRRGVGVE